MNNNYKGYAYKGPVMSYGKLLMNNYVAKTMAPTPGKAKSNIIYNYKIGHNMLPGAKIELPGKIVEISI